MNMNKNEFLYDYLIVGSGLFGATFAHRAIRNGRKCLVIEKRNHTGGNIFCEKINNITVHKYGAHIFHTNKKQIWEFITNLCEFNGFINSPMANYKGEIYNLPFNMNTFNKLWGVVTPGEAAQIIEKQQKQRKRALNLKEKLADNLEEQAIKLVGTDIYEKLIKGYTEKQWGKPCRELPAFIIKRLPVRYTYDNNYFKSRYQGIPIGGYNNIIDKLLEGCEVKTNVDFNVSQENREYYMHLAEKTVYTGRIDTFFDYKFGKLEYRSLKFETQIYNEDNYQGVAVMNYTDKETPYTRIIEHKHFEPGGKNVCGTVITREYPLYGNSAKEAYYPINDNLNQSIYDKYKEYAKTYSKNVIFGGRLAEYKYYDMDETIEAALNAAELDGLNRI